MAVQNSVSNQALLTTSSPAFNNVIPANTSTATAGGTTTLTADSTYSQFFTGVLSQTVVFPNTSGLSINTAFLIVNNSTGSVTVNASDASLIVVLSPSSQAVITCISVSVTTNAAWNTQYSLKTLAPSLNNIGLSYSGGDPSTISIMCNYSSGLLFNTFYPSLLVAQQQSFSVAGPDVMNFGNIQGFLSAFTYSQTGTTSASFPSLLYFSAAASITLPLATTFSMPNLMYCGGALTLNLNSLITLDLPALIFCNGSFGGTGTSLTTLNIPVLTTIFTTFTPTYAALTSFTATSLAWQFCTRTCVINYVVFACVDNMWGSIFSRMCISNYCNINVFGHHNRRIGCIFCIIDNAINASISQRWNYIYH